MYASPITPRGEGLCTEAGGSGNWEADCGLSSFLIQPFMWVAFLRGSASRGSWDSCGSQTLARVGRIKLWEGEVCFPGPLSPELAGVWTSACWVSRKRGNQ